MTHPVASRTTADSRPPALHPPRLVVYETHDEDELLAALASGYPATAYEHKERWSVPEPSAVGVVPVWHWRGSLDDFVNESSDVLRKFVYPLAADGSEFVVSFPFPRHELAPRSLDTGSWSWLEVEDIGHLVSADAVEARFSEIHLLPTRVLQTPIEETLERALIEAGIRPRLQAKFDRYRLDFLIESDGRRIAVEADGRDFHDSERDRRRDEALLARGIHRVFRFSGSRIYRDATGCAAEVRAFLEASDIRRRRAGHKAELDTSQQVAVAHRSGPARVLAPAGSGKTRVLVHRIAALVESGVDPGTILALAFNRKAYEQLADRLEHLGIPTSRKLFDPVNQGVVCVGFNAFGYRYQRELLDLKLRVETNPGAWRKVMADALEDVGVRLSGTRRGSDPVGNFLQALERVRADLAQPEEEVVELDHVAPAGPEVVPFAPILERFEERRLAQGIQSFDDQVATAVVDLFSSPSRRKFVQSRFSHVLVDEYQDLNGARLALVELIARPWRSLFVVGDDDQLIYGWGYAKPSNILGFHDRMPREPYSSTYALETNYRSSRAIVEASQRVIDNNTNRVPKGIRAAPEAAAGEVHYVRADDWIERAEALVSFLQDRRENTRRWSDLAVLCRFKAQQPLVALALDRAGIPRSPLLAYRLFSDANASLLRAYIDLVRSPKGLDADSFRFLLNRPNRYLTNELVDEVVNADSPWAEICDRLKEDGTPIGLVDLADRVFALRTKYRETPPSSLALIDDVILTFGLEEYWHDRDASALRRADDGGALVIVDLLRFHAAEMDVPSEFIDFWNARAEGENQRFDVRDDSLGREQPPDGDHVVINTIHASKGREYDSVVLLDYDVDLRNLADPAIEEERRVFYVGLTRARNSVMMTIDGRQRGAHRFIRESIRPPESGERGAAHRLVRGLREREEGLVVDCARAQERIDAVFSGDEAKSLEAEIAARQEALTSDEAALTDLEIWLGAGGIRGVWRRISREGRTRAEVASSLRRAIEKRRLELAALRDRLVLLRSDPALAAASARDELEAGQCVLLATREETRALRARIAELDLLTVHVAGGGSLDGAA